MLWVLLAVGLVLLALAALAAALLRTWRTTKSLTRELSRASEAVEQASVGLEPPRPDARSSPRGHVPAAERPSPGVP